MPLTRSLHRAFVEMSACPGTFAGSHPYCVNGNFSIPFSTAAVFIIWLENPALRSSVRENFRRSWS